MTITDLKIDFPMTREKYVSSWKIFRAISDENEITAQHILGLPVWSKSITNIFDVGCGDGLVTRELILRSKQNFDKIKLLDPDTLMLDEAVHSIKNTNKVNEIKSLNLNLEGCYELESINVDIILAIHLVYLIEKESLLSLIHNLPQNTPLIIVFDAESSIFTKLWERTAKKYHDRSSFARNFIDSLDVNTFSINKTYITSNFVNPYDRSKIEKDALISLLTYSDYSKFSLNDKKFISNLILNNLKNNNLNCKSVCYEIIKR